MSTTIIKQLALNFSQQISREWLVGNTAVGGADYRCLTVEHGLTHRVKFKIINLDRVATASGNIEWHGIEVKELHRTNTLLLNTPSIAFCYMWPKSWRNDDWPAWKKCIVDSLPTAFDNWIEDGYKPGETTIVPHVNHLIPRLKKMEDLEKYNRSIVIYGHRLETKKNSNSLKATSKKLPPPKLTHEDDFTKITFENDNLVDLTVVAEWEANYQDGETKHTWDEIMDGLLADWQRRNIHTQPS